MRHFISSICLLAALNTIAVASTTTKPASSFATEAPLLSDQKDEVVIPLARVENLLAARVTIGGQDAGWFMVDTGATSTIIDAKLALKLGLVAIGPEHAGVLDAAGKVPSGMRTVIARDVVLLGTSGSVTHSRVVAIAGDLSVFKMSGVEFAGVLGLDVLGSGPLILDTRDATLTFIRRDRFDATTASRANASHVTTRNGDHTQVLVPAKLNDHEVFLQLDTGDSGELDVERWFMNVWDLNPLPHSRRAPAFAMSGVSPSGIGLLGSVELFGRTFVDRYAYFRWENRGDLYHKAGAIGMQMFRDGARLTIDYANDQLWCEWLPRESDAEYLSRLGDAKKRDVAGVTPLMRAAADPDRAAVVQTLLGAGADVNAKSNMNMTALIFAASSGDVSVVRTLLEHIANPNEATTVLAATALHAAAMRGRVDVTRELITHDAKIDARRTDGFSPLMCAAEADWPEVISVLIDAGADVSFVSKDKTTALMLATKSAASVAAVLKGRPALETKGENGFTALGYACLAGRTEAARVLLDAGASIDANENDSQVTPLMLAASRGHADVIRLLLSRGADMRRRSKDGYTASDYAVAASKADAARILLLTEDDSKRGK